VVPALMSFMMRKKVQALFVDYYPSIAELVISVC
jgi:hypothetical protein